MKTIRHMLVVLAAATGLAALAACAQVVAPEHQTGNATGRVVLSVSAGAENARTILPTDPPTFSRYELVFTSSSESAVTAPSTAGIDEAGVSQDLAPGTWTATVKAYRMFTPTAGSNSGTPTEYLAAEGSAQVTVTGGQVTPVTVTLRPVAIGESAVKGIFTYRVDFPAGVPNAHLYLRTGSTTVLSVSLTPGQEVSVEIAPGYYDLSISLMKGPWNAGTMEKAHVYSGLESKAAFTFADADFVMPAPLTAGTWKPANSATEGPVIAVAIHWYTFNATAGVTYALQWEDTGGNKEDQAPLVAYNSDGNPLGWGQAFLTLTPSSSGIIYAGVSSPPGSYRVRYYDVTTLPPQIAPSVQPGPNYTITFYSMPVEGATQYQIHRSATEKGAYSQIGILPNGTTNYTDDTAASGTFWYKVRAANAHGNGPFSDPFPLSALIPLAANTVIHGNLTSPNQVDWYSFEVTAGILYNLQLSTNDGYSSVNVAAYDSGGGSLLGGNYSGGPAIRSGFLNEPIYIRVGPYYNDYLGPYTIRCYDPSTLPLEYAPGLVQSWIPISGYTIKWVSVNGDANGYTIYRSATKDGSYSPIGTAGAGSTSYTDSTAVSGNYWYKVQAVNGSGAGPISDPALVSSAQVVPLTQNTPANGTLAGWFVTYNQQVDWYSFSAIANHVYCLEGEWEFDVTGGGGSGSGEDDDFVIIGPPMIDVYDSFGYRLAGNMMGLGQPQVMVTSNQTLYVSIGGSNSNYTIKYYE